ncbi:hypothetical protein [Mucilaginibacter sp.]|uniref:hypothetical protein n=1 Tax=Mucilaginibacter sp. TaxID=1882438 RepID=UPI003264A5C9
MTAEEYIILQLISLVNKFPNIRARYDNDRSSNSHVIEIIPNHFYHNDEKFRVVEDDIIDNFIKEFPYENVVFLSGDDLYKLEKIDHEFVGNNFCKNPALISINQILTSFTGINNDLLQELFEKYDAQMEHHFKIQMSKSFFKQPIGVIATNINIYPKKTGVLNTIDTITSLADDTTYSEAGQNNYALAA